MIKEKYSLIVQRMLQSIFFLLFGIFVFTRLVFANAVIITSEMQLAVSAALTCPLADEVEDAEKVLPTAARPISPTAEEIKRCLKSADDIKRFVHAGKSLVIDVRDELHQITHIDGTISVPLYALHSKNFIRERNVVLLGNGVNDFHLVHECVRLQNSGVKRAYVLQGGVRMWEQKVVNGDAFLQLQDKMVAARDIYTLELGRDWLLLTDSLSNTTAQEIRKIFPGSQLFAVSSKQGLGRILKKYKDGPALVMTETGKDYHAISALLQSYEIKNDFYLEGGIAAYRQYLMTQQAYLKRARDFAEKKKNLCGG